MSLSIQGPRWPVSKISALVAIEQQAERCWRVNRYLGSMLTFDFGERVSQQSRRGGALELGSSRLGVRDCAWLAEAAGRAWTSDEADETTAEALTEAFQGAAMTGCDRRRRWLSFHFTSGARLHLDLTTRYEAEADEFVASLALSGGAYFEMLPDGAWEMAPSEDAVPQRVAAA